jgi:hypothetical protein
MVALWLKQTEDFSKPVSGEIHDKLHKAIPFCLKVTQLYGTHVNVICYGHKESIAFPAVFPWNTQLWFAQICCYKFHPNVVLKKAEVEIYPCPEVKYGSVCATCHRIQSLTKLL